MYAKMTERLKARHKEAKKECVMSQKRVTWVSEAQAATPEKRSECFHLRLLISSPHEFCHFSPPRCLEDPPKSSS
jgi:hypothetical protein